MTVVETLQEALQGMTPINRKIADYVLADPRSVAFSSIYDVSAAIGVSNATVVRFARSLGFEGWTELKRSLQREIKRGLSPREKAALSGLAVLPRDAQLEQICETTLASIRKSLSGLSLDDLQRIADGVIAAKRVFLSGFGISKHIVNILAYTLSSVFDKAVVTLTGSISDFAPHFRNLGPDDALVLMTFATYSPEALYVARDAKDHRAKLFLFTDSTSCPVYGLADAAVRCESNAIIITDSFVGLVAVMQVFVNLLLLSDKSLSSLGYREVAEVEQRGYSRMAEDGISF